MKAIGARWICKCCGVKFRRAAGRPRPKFCGQLCYRQWKADNRAWGEGAFKDGSQPWNKGLKGFRASPATEFKKGPRPDHRFPLGTVTLRLNKKEGKMRAWIKVAEPNVWRSRATVVWEAVNGPLPRGMVIHHRDRDTLNDDIDNLEALTRAQHVEEHRDEVC